MTVVSRSFNVRGLDFVKFNIWHQVIHSYISIVIFGLVHSLTACSGSSFSGAGGTPVGPTSTVPSSTASTTTSPTTSVGNSTATATTATTTGAVPAGVDPSTTIGGGAICNQNVAVALLMDVSQSMSEPADGSSGGGYYDNGGGYGGGNYTAKIDIAIQDAENFVGQFTKANDMIGLVYFSDDPTIAAPMSTNKSVVQSALGQLDTIQGTNITDGLTAAASLFANVPSTYTKVLILMSDGQNRAPGDPVAAAAAIKQTGVVILTLGFMADSGQADMQAMASDPSYYYDSSNSTSFTQNFATIAAKLCR